MYAPEEEKKPETLFIFCVQTNYFKNKLSESSKRRFVSKQLNRQWE